MTITEYLNQQNVSVEDVCRSIDIERQTYIDYLHGRQPSEEMIVRLSKYFGFNPKDFIGE